MPCYINHYTNGYKVMCLAKSPRCPSQTLQLLTPLGDFFCLSHKIVEARKVRLFAFLCYLYACLVTFLPVEFYSRRISGRVQRSKVRDTHLPLSRLANHMPNTTCPTPSSLSFPPSIFDISLPVSNCLSIRSRPP